MKPVLIAAAIVAAYVLMALANGQNEIAQVYCAPKFPVIRIVPASAKKSAVSLAWNEAEKEWRWEDPATGKWVAVPVRFFDNGSNGWWISKAEPRFGTRESWMFGIGAKIGSWRWTGAEWTGTGAPPLVHH